MKRLAVDTNAVVDLIRVDRSDPPYLLEASTKVLPLPVLAELLVGARLSLRSEENLNAIARLEEKWTVLAADRQTAHIYASIVASVMPAEAGSRKERGRRNDHWIAAICLQHELPLLTNDRGFDDIEGLNVIHW